MTREKRRNNPLGVSVSRTFNWQNVDLSFPGVAGSDGILTPGVDNELNDHLVVFKEMQDGANAAAWLLHALYFKPDSNTPETLGNKWAGDNENKANAAHRMSYGDSIASIMKDKPLQVLDYTIDGPLVMQALAREENGAAEAEELGVDLWTNAIQYGALQNT